MKLYSAYNENSEWVWYQNDIIFNVIKPILNGTTQSIDIGRLFQDSQFDWISFPQNFNHYVSITPQLTVSDVTYGYGFGTGSYLLYINNVDTSGTVLRINPDYGSPDSESRIFTIPFMRIPEPDVPL